jgi:hypothetical protein
VTTVGDFLPSDYFDWQEPMALLPVESPGMGISYLLYAPSMHGGWDGLTKLRWIAGTILCDTGLTVQVSRAKPFAYRGLNGGRYAVQVGPGVRLSMTFREASSYLHGVKRGAEAVARNL